MRQVHVLPDGATGREHTVTTQCWCIPEVVRVGEYTVKVVHQVEEAADG